MFQSSKILLDGPFLEARITWLQFYSFCKIAGYFAKVLVLISLGGVILSQAKFNLVS